ncbi:MAG: hypothetical protein ACK5LZ_04835 [Anaerorhabdus sp.]
MNKFKERLEKNMPDNCRISAMHVFDNFLDNVKEVEIYIKNIDTQDHYEFILKKNEIGDGVKAVRGIVSGLQQNEKLNFSWKDGLEKNLVLEK